MKKILVALAISLGASTAYAQVVDVSYGHDVDSPETLFLPKSE
jgi:hypothetical protein